METTVRNLAFSLIILTANSAYTADGCSVDIKTNHGRAEVTVDGKVVGKTPVQVACQQKPQTIHVQSDDNQVFTRVMPAIDQLTNVDRAWNVYFVPKQRQAIQTAQYSSGPSASATGTSPDILAELREMKAMLNRLLERHPELAPQVQLAKASNRAVSSVPMVLAAPSVAVAATPKPAPVTQTIVAAPMMTPADQPTKESAETFTMEGAYVQLHSLLHKDFIKEDVIKEFGSQVNEAGSARLAFCKWRSDEKNPMWTRVMMGPYDKESAKKVVQLIGRDARVVTSPRCHSQRFDVSF